MALTASRKTVLILLAILVVAGGAGGYLFAQLTADPGVELRQNPNPVEAREAIRKVGLFEEARAHNRRGFIRLSEVEINSYLGETVFTNRLQTNGLTLVRGNVLLNDEGFTFVSRIETPFFGFQLPIVWQRRVKLVKDDTGCQVALTRMQVGRMEIPRNWWPRVEEMFGGFDPRFADRFSWIQKVPTLEIAKNELSKAPELRLYTFVPQETETK